MISSRPVTGKADRHRLLRTKFHMHGILVDDGGEKFRELSTERTKINKKKVERCVGQSIMLVTACSPAV